MMKETEKKSTKKKVTQAVSFIITFVIAYFGVQYLFFNTNPEEELANAAQEINEAMPKLIDKDTRLDSASTVSDKVFNYHYTLVNIEKSEVNVDTLQKYFGNKITESVKKSPDLQGFRDRKITMGYTYYDKNGNFVTTIKVTPEMYEN